MEIKVGDDSFRIHRDFRLLRARKVIAAKTTL